jgi:hypothetical protein
MGRVPRWLAGLEFGDMWQLAVAVILAATALFGGLDTVDTMVTPFKPGEDFSDGEFTVNIDRATPGQRAPRRWRRDRAGQTRTSIRGGGGQDSQ